MNSLNILSARVSPPPTPTPSRSNSYGDILSSTTTSRSRGTSRVYNSVEKPEIVDDAQDARDRSSREAEEEDTPLLEVEKDPITNERVSRWLTIPKIVTDAFVNSIRWIISAVARPGIFLLALMYDDGERFAPFSMVHQRTGKASDRQLAGIQSTGGGSLEQHISKRSTIGRSSSSKAGRALSSNSSSSGMSSDSDSEHSLSKKELVDSGATGLRYKRSKTSQRVDEIAPARRSIRIKLHHEDNSRPRKQRKPPTTSTDSNHSAVIPTAEIFPANLKSPTSPASSLMLTKYPRAPAPPRPLIPRRQPSYNLLEPLGGQMTQKTLILDLDETLIHSLAKGGRMSTGHMVEVKLNTLVGAGGSATVGPQHPILYYVHKRPHCDDFLRRVCKWYNLVIFTASVQEYADPVIDWLEQERKFFSGRYYRQHCTYRHGAFIKDLSSVEPDLSKVMILDNSPLSYMFHQDNAIPIEGWINDPTDNDLLHLVPMLEGLQYVTDVRAFLALRGGEDGKHMVA